MLNLSYSLTLWDPGGTTILVHFDSLNGDMFATGMLALATNVLGASHKLASYLSYV